MNPTETRQRMATIDRELTSIRHGEQGWDATVLARRDTLEAEHRDLWHTLYTHGEDPPRRSNGWGAR